VDDGTERRARRAAVFAARLFAAALRANAALRVDRLEQHEQRLAGVSHRAQREAAAELLAERGERAAHRTRGCRVAGWLRT
jgi:hypothetical protein